MPPQDNTKDQITATQGLRDSAKALQRALAQGNVAAQAQVKALNSSARGVKPMQTAFENVRDSTNDLHAQLGTVGSELMGALKQAINPMAMLGQAITQGISQADKYQQGALRMGMDVNDIVGKFPGEMSNVTGGFVAAMDATFKQTEMGMNKLGKHTSLAAVRTSALGGNIDGLIKSQRRMETSLGMDQEAVDRSSKRMIQLSQQYGISSDRLVAAMENLAKSENTMAALGIGEDTNKSVMELTAKFGAGNEKLIGEFTNSMLATGSKAVQHSVLGGVQDLQTAMMQGTATTEQMEKGILKQGNKYLNIVRNMQANGTQMNVALHTLESMFGPGAQAAMKLAQSYENMTPEQIALEEKSAQIQQDWGNTLSIVKNEILTPIKVAIAKKLPEIIEIFKKYSPIFKGILKGMMIVASSILIKRGLGAMMAGGAGGDPLRAMMGMGAMGVGVGALGTGMGVETGGGAQAGLGIAMGLLPLAATMFSKKKGFLGAAQYGFGKKGGDTSMLAEKLGSAANPMHVMVINAWEMGGDAGDGGGTGSGRMMQNALTKFSNTKIGRKIPGLRKLTKVLGRSTTTAARSGSIMSRGMSAMGRTGQMMSKGAASVFGKTGIINKGMGTAVRGIARTTGPVIGKGVGGMLKKLGGRSAARAFGGFLGKNLARAAAVQVVPVLGQVVGGVMLAATAVQIGFSLWKWRKEKQEGEKAAAIAEDLHERQKDKIKSEIEAFNAGLQKHDNYLQISNDELRKSMRQAMSGRSEAQVLAEIAANGAETVKLAAASMQVQDSIDTNTAPKLEGPES